MGSNLARFLFGLLFEESFYPKRDESATFEGLCTLMRNNYWHRIWIVQEIALSNRGVVVCLGEAVPLEEFIAAYSSIWLLLNHGVYTLHECTKNFGYGMPSFIYPRNVPL